MKKIFLLASVTLFAIIANAQNVGIGTSIPHPSAILELSSTTKGLLLPQMTYLQREAIVAPKTGLLIYQTDFGGGVFTYNGVGWIPTNNNYFVDMVNSQIIDGPKYFVKDIYASGIRIGDGNGTPLNPNTGVGVNMLNSNTTGYWNTAMGYYAMYKNTIGNSNAAFGDEALNDNTIGNRNTALGFKALLRNIDADDNTATGNSALVLNTHGNFNTANGSNALLNNTFGDANTAMGYDALYTNTLGDANTAMGNFALKENTIGANNVAIGNYALEQSTTKSGLVAIGDSAMYKNAGGNVAFLTTQAVQNTAVGTISMMNNLTGSQNTAIGYKAMYTNDIGSENIAVGYNSMIGELSGNRNIAIGNGAMTTVTTGNYNTALGSHTFNSGNFTNSTAIGDATQATASNQIRFGDGGIQSIGGFQGWTNVSDARFKKDIQSNVPGLDFINKLKPVTYHLDMNAIAKLLNTPDSLRKPAAEKMTNDMLQTGFIAQEVEQAANDTNFDFSGVDKPKNEKDFYGLRYAFFVVPLVKGMQEQQKMIEAQHKQIDALLTQNKIIMAEINQLKNK